MKTMNVEKDYVCYKSSVLNGYTVCWLSDIIDDLNDYDVVTWGTLDEIDEYLDSLC